MRFTHLAGAAAAVILFIGGVSPVQADHISCGDVIGPNENVTLDEDIGPCSTNPALEVRSGSKLDGGGYTVSCLTQGTDGIKLIESRAKLSNVEVLGCRFGVWITGSTNSFHKVENVTSVGNDYGFYIERRKNLVEKSRAVENDRWGFSVVNRYNNLSWNTASENLWDGFYLNSNSDGSSLIGNHSNLNTQSGFEFVNGGNGITVEENSAVGNHQYGFQVNSANNKFKKNVAALNDFSGFVFGNAGGNNKVENNQSDENGHRGFYLSGGDNNKLENNHADKNDHEGFRASSSAENNLIANNVAHLNGTEDGRDDEANCGTNTWEQNAFGTTNRACVE